MKKPARARQGFLNKSGRIGLLGKSQAVAQFFSLLETLIGGQP